MPGVHRGDTGTQSSTAKQCDVPCAQHCYHRGSPAAGAVQEYAHAYVMTTAADSQAAAENTRGASKSHLLVGAHAPGMQTQNRLCM